MSFVFGEEGLSYGPRALAIGADNLLQEMDKSGYAAIDKANEIIDQGLKEGREAKQIDLRQLEAGMKLYRDRHLEGEKPRYHVPTRSAMTLARSVQAPMSVSRVFARR